MFLSGITITFGVDTAHVEPVSRFWADQQLLKVPSSSFILNSAAAASQWWKIQKDSLGLQTKSMLALWLQPSAKKNKNKKRHWASCSIFHVIRSLIALLRRVSLPLVTSQCRFFSRAVTDGLGLFISLLNSMKITGQRLFLFIYFTRALELEHLTFRFRLTAAKSVFWSIQPKIWRCRRRVSPASAAPVCFLSGIFACYFGSKAGRDLKPFDPHRGCRAL